MTDRTEPKLNTGLNFLGLGTKKEKSPEELMTDALSVVLEAQSKLNEAQEAIQTQVKDHEAVIADRQAKVEAASQHLTRLERIKLRFEDLLA